MNRACSFKIQYQQTIVRSSSLSMRSRTLASSNCASLKVKKFQVRPAQALDEPLLAYYTVYIIVGPGSADEIQGFLGLTPYLVEMVSSREKIRDDPVAAVAGVGQVASFDAPRGRRPQRNRARWRLARVHIATQATVM